MEGLTFMPLISMQPEKPDCKHEKIQGNSDGPLNPEAGRKYWIICRGMPVEHAHGEKGLNR